MTEIEVNVTGETCPVPLVEFRKAVRKAAEGDVIRVVGNHGSSLKEIPMAAEALGLEIIDVEERGADWTIRVRR